MIEQLRAGRAEGLSFAHIARRIGGVSRNACIGKALRLGFEHHQRPTSTGPAKVRVPNPLGARLGRQVNPRTTQRVASAELHAKRLAEEPAPIGPLLDVVKSGFCKWIHGHPAVDKDWRCCGHPVAHEATPWCEHHHARVADGTQRRKPVAA